MCLSDCSDYKRFWAKNVLRLDFELWTSILNDSGLFGKQGRFLPAEWCSWTKNGKTITFELAFTKNRGKHFYY